MRYVAISILSLFLTLLAGCGQKGDLYLPNGDATRASAGEAPTASQDDDRDPVDVDRPPL